MIIIIIIMMHKLKIQLQRGFQIQPTRPKQRNLGGNQEIMLIWGLSFPVTTKLLQVTIRPLILEVKSDLLRISW